MASGQKNNPLAQHAEQHDPAVTTIDDVTVLAAEGLEQAKQSPWTISMLRLYGCLLIGYLCATTNGFDGSVMGFVASASIESIGIY